MWFMLVSSMSAQIQAGFQLAAECEYNCHETPCKNNVRQMFSILAATKPSCKNSIVTKPLARSLLCAAITLRMNSMFKC